MQRESAEHRHAAQGVIEEIERNHRKREQASPQPCEPAIHPEVRDHHHSQGEDRRQQEVFPEQYEGEEQQEQGRAYQGDLDRLAPSQVESCRPGNPVPLQQQEDPGDGTVQQVGAQGPPEAPALEVGSLDLRTDEGAEPPVPEPVAEDRKSTRLNSSHLVISYAVFCLKKKKHFTSLA